ncbi:MAG: hypothetical protein JW888_10170 [Pirellulales bacterium]|nr:hypothetical protein [Pirellulales bacterium]
MTDNSAEIAGSTDRTGGDRSAGDVDSVTRLPGFTEEARAFWQLRARIAGAQVRQALAHSRLRLSLIAVLSLLLWAGMFWLFIDGFRFLKTSIQHAAAYDTVVQSVFAMFFTALMVMLVFSSAILVYGFLFRARDLTLLLSLPASVERVFLYKFQETVFFSGWAFLLLGSPMLLAYGLMERAPWYYYAELLPFLVAFSYIPTGVGALVCLLVVYYVPRGRHHVLTAAGLVAIGLAAWVAWTLITSPRGTMLTPIWFQEAVSRLHFSEQQLLPSWWLSCGLLEAAHRGWDQSVLFLSVLIANALLIRQVTVRIAARCYRVAHSQLHSAGTSRKKTKPIWIDRAMVRALPVPLTVRLMLVKDFRLFRRDPSQWSQFLLFFALLAFYFINIRRFGSQSEAVGWANMMSFVNLTVVGLILSTLTTRHVFPMISLEGQRLGLLALLGLRRGTILWSKMALAVGGSLIPCALLVWVSDAMLSIRGALQLSHQWTCLLLCVGLSGIAVGLGAKMPNLREESPPRIASGFGGTLNLVVSALYIVLIVMLAAMPWHFHALAQHQSAADFLIARPGLLWWLKVWLWGGTIGSVCLAFVATAVPLRIGFRAFQALEV